VRYLIIITVLLLLFFAALAFGPGLAGENIGKAIPKATFDESGMSGTQTAVLAGGCFWGLQGAFSHVKGVSEVISGYSGGEKSTATYDQVTTETTGHAEAVKISYDPKQVSYGTLLRIFFSVVHDPTQLDRQGPDVGNSYRSEIFAVTPEQERIANAYTEQLSKARVFDAPIVTRIERLKGFYAAEDYHQNYLVNHPTQPYIVRYDLPKIQALKKVYPGLYRE
jgi:peptide-methionine (S)-S-oxide reductase